ncbi:TonB-dependent receptor [Myroides profundi]|uniref:Iron complex outermembrane recepter protein n=1 Tax=Myroides profundi TaxID=480520 RepID=A0AAJ4W3H2_MYRPR|nr:TonB-dependent receptor [Myroides profundi]AJH16655.1 iron complex outermembrane recepter protein [Myroides profundi]SEQ78707.1 iron complex outermembrane recepter protein [Myroides profundi]
MRLINTLLFTIGGVIVSIAQTSTIKGRVVDETNKPIPFATVFVGEGNVATQAGENGEFKLIDVPRGKALVKVSSVGFVDAQRELNVAKTDEVLNFVLSSDSQLNNITVYGRSNKDVKKLQYLTRLPLGLQDQVQSISIVSGHIIKEQGALTITDAARNVAGVVQFSNYGGPAESMSIRGFRGTPVLRNGVGMDSDFRTASAMADMQGVESVEVIKGSAAVLQGIGNGLGAAGGVINLVTKTPNFQNKREVSFRTGSYGHVRPAFDLEQVLDKKETVSFRLNAAYERNDGWRTHTGNDHFYINPSLAWKIDDKTKLTVEMDYLSGDYTPDRGTVNLAPDYVEALYEMPHNKFLGFKGDNQSIKMQNYVARFERKLTDKLTFRTSYTASIYNEDSRTTSVGTVKKKNDITDWNDFQNIRRTVSRGETGDYNSVFQADLVGKDIFTGVLKHTFQIGFDYRQTKTNSGSVTGQVWGKDKNGNPALVNYTNDINVLGPIDNTFPEDIIFGDINKTRTMSPTIGFMVQDYVAIGDKLSAMLGVRYSRLNGSTTENATIDRWNPIFGLIYKPVENVSAFASYTTTSSLRQSNKLIHGGGTAGASDTKQYEFGFKSNWLNDRLGFNFSYFFINQDNLLAPYIDPITNEQSKTESILVGSLKRNGFEVEVNGKITNNLEVMLGYAYLDARYKDSPNYVDGSAPMNAPHNVANGWVNYKFDQGTLNGLSLGLGVYYVGSRPVNEFTMTPDGHGSNVNKRPFDMPSYITANGQISYTYKNATLGVYMNNIFNELGYTSYYRGGYINEIAPRNFAAQLTYRF